LQEFGPYLRKTPKNIINETEINLKIANIYFFFKLLTVLIAKNIKEISMKKNQYVM